MYRHCITCTGTGILHVSLGTGNRQNLAAEQSLHATHWPHVRGLSASAGKPGVWLRAIESEINAALWALVAGEGL